MKVLCIRNGNYDFVTRQHMDSLLCEGEVYAVIHQQQEEEGLYYALAEFGTNIGFHSQLFIPLSEIDETEIIKDRILQPKKITHAEFIDNSNAAIRLLAGQAPGAFTEKESDGRKDL